MGFFPSIPTASIGWKHYFTQRKFSPFTVINVGYSNLIITHGFTQALAFGIEYEYTYNNAIQLGCSFYNSKIKEIDFLNVFGIYADDYTHTFLTPVLFINLDLRPSPF